MLESWKSVVASFDKFHKNAQSGNGEAAKKKCYNQEVSLY